MSRSSIAEIKEADQRGQMQARLAQSLMELGDALATLKTLPDESVDCCVTSPPYWGLRDYGVEGQIGLEESPGEYVRRLVEVFEEVRRVLRPHGTLWLNLGDSFGPDKQLLGIPWRVALALQQAGWILRSDIVWTKGTSGDLRWGNPMPESVDDRPQRAHEYVFLLTKKKRYFYDWAAIAEGGLSDHASGNGFARPHRLSLEGRGQEAQWRPGAPVRSRSVWAIQPRPFPGAHFAVMPLELARRCVMAGCPPHLCPCGKPWERVHARREVEANGAAIGGYPGRKAGGHRKRAPKSSGGGNVLATVRVAGDFAPACGCGAEPVSGVVLDPFSGAGTSGVAALELGRRYLGIELNPEYLEMSRRRLARVKAQIQPLFGAPAGELGVSL